MVGNHYDIIILGSGAAGLSAALYAGRYRMNTLVVEGDDFGGATSTAGVIHNWPAVEEKDGYEIIKFMKTQAEKVGAQFISGDATGVRKEGNCFVVTTKEGDVRGDTVIVGMGTKRRRLGLPNEKELTAKGVHYCVTCDGPLYTGKKVAIVGGGDASVKGVNQLASYAEKIYLIVMLDHLNAEPVNQSQMEALGDKVEVLYETQVKEIVGTQMLEHVVLDKEQGGSARLDVDGLFIEIGAVPNVKLLEPLGVALDEKGYIQVDNMMKTNVEGLYAAGDAVNHFGSFKQDVTASALGAVAATGAYEFNRKYGDPCAIHAQNPEGVQNG